MSMDTLGIVIVFLSPEQFSSMELGHLAIQRNAMNKGELIIGLFWDLTKTFDTVNHTIVLQKVTHYGIIGTALQ